MLKICHPCLRMTWSFLQDPSRAVSRFSRGPVAGNHRQHAFDSTGLQSPIGSPSWIKKSADGDFLQLGPWKSVKQLWIDRSSRKLQLILRRGRAISKISEAKAHANVLKGTFSTDCKSNCVRIGLKVPKLHKNWPKGPKMVTINRNGNSNPRCLWCPML